jgi:hypothetical protein
MGMALHAEALLNLFEELFLLAVELFGEDHLDLGDQISAPPSVNIGNPFPPEDELGPVPGTRFEPEFQLSVEGGDGDGLSEDALGEENGDFDIEVVPFPDKVFVLLHIEEDVKIPPTAVEVFVALSGNA